MDSSKILFKRGVTIRGVTIPDAIFSFGGKTMRFKPLDHIWQYLKKRIFESYGVLIFGFFENIEEKNRIECRFDLDYGVLSKLGITSSAYAKMYYNTFAEWTAMMEHAFCEWFEDPKGYDAYMALLAENDGSEEAYIRVKALTNTFLRDKGIRTKADDREKAAREARLAESRKAVGATGK